MKPIADKLRRQFQMARNSSRLTKVVVCCMSLIFVFLLARIGKAAPATTTSIPIHRRTLKRRNPFFNPAAIPAGTVTVDQVVSLKEVPVPVPMAVVIPASSGIPGPSIPLNFQGLGNCSTPTSPCIVRSNAALIRLGKALFWDMQVGSDGVQACATCHFNAGADIRTRNQLSPNLSDTNFHANNPPNGDGLGGDNLWGDSTVPFTANDPNTPSPPGPVEPPPAALNKPGHPGFGPNYIMSAADFPLNDWIHPTQLVPRGPSVTLAEEMADVSSDTNDIMASQGIVLNKFAGIQNGSAVDLGTASPDIFNTATPGVLNVNNRVRRAMPRNAPTMINAVFNFDNLWEGKASFIFNGVDAFGFRDRSKTLQVVSGGQLTKVFVRITNSSLASVAAAVPTNNIAMSYNGRTMPDVGQKMVHLRPLGKQFVAPDDSVLGAFSLSPNRGLNIATYRQMIEAAFQPRWWNIADTVVACTSQIGTAPPIPHTLRECNFSLFFGLAVQAYQATLVSDDTAFDRFMGAPNPVRCDPTWTVPCTPATAGQPIPPDPTALTEQQLVGLTLFNDDDPNIGTHCADCHVPPVMTGHTVLDYQPDSQGVPSLAMGEAIEFMFMGDNGQEANYDHGMYNIGVRRSCVLGVDPTTCPKHNEDKGRGATANAPVAATPGSPFGTPNSQFFNPLKSTTVNITSISRASNVVTVNTSTNPFTTGQTVVIANVGTVSSTDTPFNGAFTITVVSPTKFTYALVGNDASGTLTSATGAAIATVGTPFPLSLVELTALRDDTSCDTSPLPHVGCLPPDVARFIPDVPILPRRVTNGAFKAPNLRNIKYSGPYFHVGDSATLRQVVEFYTRGGNFPNTNLHDKTVDVEGIPPFMFPESNPSALQNIQALVDFLAEGLKDPRVAFEKAPFDHPELLVPNWKDIPAVGKNGRGSELPTFLGLDPQTP